MRKVTRTTNPLHFEDLEPHRFEDLVRQLIYGFRAWRSLEAVGRSGSDDGIDILGTELFMESTPDLDLTPEDYEGEEITRTEVEERQWVVQCKRQQSIGPKEVRSIIGDFMDNVESPPYAYMLVAACNFSMKARETFRDALAQHRIQEGHIFGKAELEDLLFLPENDHLLFAYFGISFRIRRKSLKSLYRARLATKRKLVRILGDIRDPGYEALLIRDPSDQEYPFIRDIDEFSTRPSWRYWQFDSHQPPNHVALVSRKHFAYLNLETQEWDVLPELDLSTTVGKDLHGLERDWDDPEGLDRRYRAYWNLEVPEEHRAWTVELSHIHYDRIIAVDELGDLYNEGPHLLVDFIGGSPFEDRTYYYLESYRNRFARHVEPDPDRRIEFFPQDIPDRHDEWMEQLRNSSGASARNC